MGLILSVKTLKTPMDTKALGCKNMSSDEDIGVELKKAKRVFFGIGRTRHPDKTEYKEKILIIQEGQGTVRTPEDGIRNY